MDWLQQFLQSQQPPAPAKPGQMPNASQEALQQPMIDPISMLAMAPTMGMGAMGRAAMGRILMGLLRNYLTKRQQPQQQMGVGR